MFEDFPELTWREFLTLTYIYLSPLPKESRQGTSIIKDSLVKKGYLTYDYDERDRKFVKLTNLADRLMERLTLNQYKDMPEELFRLKVNIKVLYRKAQKNQDIRKDFLIVFHQYAPKEEDQNDDKK